MSPIDVIDLDKKLSLLMDQIFAQAANGSSNPSFATGTAVLRNLKTIHGFAQCIPHISVGKCKECLLSTLANCNDKQWATAVLLNCQLRLDVHPLQ